MPSSIPDARGVSFSGSGGYGQQSTPDDFYQNLINQFSAVTPQSGGQPGKSPVVTKSNQGANPFFQQLANFNSPAGGTMDLQNGLGGYYQF